jgi:hypothetical protein
MGNDLRPLAETANGTHAGALSLAEQMHDRRVKADDVERIT